MINSKYQKIVFSFFMALLMSCLMSLIISLFNMGFSPNIVNVWLKAWIFSFSVAFPTIIFISPFVHKLVALVSTKNAIKGLDHDDKHNKTLRSCQ